MRNKIARWFVPKRGPFVCPFCKKKTRVLFVFMFNELYAQMCHICFKYGNIERIR